MRDTFDYFTVWAVIAVICSLVIIVLGRVLGRPQSWLCAFFIPLTAVVSLIGTDTVGYHLEIPKTNSRKKVIRSHLWLHTVPLYASLIVLCNWKHVVGEEKLTNRKILTGGGLLAAFAGAYCNTKLDSGETFLDKISTVYNTKDPLMFVLVGTFIAIATSLSLREYSKHI